MALAMQTQTLLKLMQKVDHVVSDGFMDVVTVVAALIGFFILVRFGEGSLFPGARPMPGWRSHG